MRLPDSKTGAKLVHLGHPAITVLRGISREDDAPWVIAGSKPSAPLNDLRYDWRRIRNRSNTFETAEPDAANAHLPTTNPLCQCDRGTAPRGISVREESAGTSSEARQRRANRHGRLASTSPTV